MFIARISRGRTIRQFVGGVLIVPVLFTFLWMTVFGNSAIELGMNGVAPVADTVANNLPIALFEVLGQLPFSAIASGIATLLIITFFITSAESGALVMDLIASGGAENPPVWQRVFWAVCSGGIAAVLLMAGGLQAIQTAAIMSALPFAFVMIFICYGLVRALPMEGRSTAMDFGTVAIPTAGGSGPSWQQRLGSIVEHHGRDELLSYLDGVAAPG